MRALLPIGQTYAHWMVLGYLEDRRYLVLCPQCKGHTERTRQEMERTERCATCAKKSQRRRHKGSVCR